MTTTVKKVMTSKLITIPSGTGQWQASQLMSEKRIRHLPVVDDNQDIIGVISQRDLNLSLPNGEDIPVDWSMSSAIQSVDENLPLRQAVYQMLQLKISCLLVTSGEEEVVGIVTTDDLLWHLAHLLNGASEKRTQLGTAMGIQTIGTVANQLSNMGI